MFRLTRTRIAVTALGIILGGIMGGAPSSASAAETVRWLSIDPGRGEGVLSSGRAETFDTGSHYLAAVAFSDSSYYVLQGHIHPTPGCTYRVSSAFNGARVSSDGHPTLLARSSGDLDVIMSWWSDTAIGGAAQAAVYVAGRCDDGTYEMGNQSWFIGEDGTQSFSVLAPPGPMDPADAQRLWDEGYAVGQG